MLGNMSGVSGYQSVNQFYNNQQTNKIEKSDNVKAQGSAAADSKVKVSEWNPINPSSSLVPSLKEEYGMSIGDVQLSDKAKSYYADLKKKFGDMDFILVSKDMKSAVASHASSYGNANKPVVLIDDAKIEMMANDESVRKKYEGLIAMSQSKMQEARNSIASSGAILKSFGMSVSDDGKVSFFAAIEKSSEASAKIMEKKQAAKKEAKAKEKKQTEKEDLEERIEKQREEKKKYIEFQSDSLEALIERVSKYAFDQSAQNAKTSEESMLGQSIDFKG